MSDLDRSLRPPTGGIRPYQFPDLVNRRFENGLELLLVQKKDLPMVTALVVLDAGETRVPTEKGGLAVLTGDALEAGTGRRSGLEWARALESLGATSGVSTGWDSTTVAVSSQADRLAEALPLLGEMVRSPSFPEDEFPRYKRQCLGTVAQRAMNPGALASDEFARFLYGAHALYGRPLGGREESLAPLDAVDCRGFVESCYVPHGAGLILVGDLDAREAEALARESFGDWTGRPAGAGGDVAPPDMEAGVLLVHRPGAVQSEIRVGHGGIPRDAPDYFAVRILNLILGGSFTSRLNLNLREKNGFTYGVRSRFITRRGAGPFVVSTAVESAVTGAAVSEIHGEIGALANDGPTAAEVETAVSYLSGVFPLKLETTGQIAAQAAEIIVYGLEQDYYHRYRKRIRDVSFAAVGEAAEARLRPAELRTVIVGDADVVAPQLEAKGLGPIVRQS
ncbi:MAG: insulinase family protein [Gemmatimonadota bacterium]|nr:insulinase family protein [Gemmatimonadota bacterium]